MIVMLGQPLGAQQNEERREQNADTAVKKTADKLPIRGEGAINDRTSVSFPLLLVVLRGFHRLRRSVPGVRSRCVSSKSARDRIS